jgi:hypothetical protein
MDFRSLLLALAVASGSAHAAQWRYQDDVDKMTGKSASYAVVESDNSLQLGSPYSGSNHGRITVRRHPKYGLDVLISVDKGQILCRAYDGCTVMIRFDSGKPQRFSVLEPADYSSETVFITNRSRFIAAAKKSKRILVQIPMFHEGEQVLEFAVPVELVWK